MTAAMLGKTHTQRCQYGCCSKFGRNKNAKRLERRIAKATERRTVRREIKEITNA